MLSIGAPQRLQLQIKEWSFELEYRNPVIHHHYRRETQVQGNRLKWQIAIIVYPLR